MDAALTSRRQATASIPWAKTLRAAPALALGMIFVHFAVNSHVVHQYLTQHMPHTGRVESSDSSRAHTKHAQDNPQVLKPRPRIDFGNSTVPFRTEPSAASLPGQPPQNQVCGKRRGTVASIRVNSTSQCHIFYLHMHSQDLRLQWW